MVKTVPHTCTYIDDVISKFEEIKIAVTNAEANEDSLSDVRELVSSESKNIVNLLEELRTMNSRLRDNWHHEESAREEFESDLEKANDRIKELEERVEDLENFAY